MEGEGVRRVSQGCIVCVAALEFAGKYALPETDRRSSRGPVARPAV